MTIQSTNGAIGASNSGASRILRSPAPSPQSPPPAAVRRGGHDSPKLREAFNDFVGQTFFGELVKQMRATVKKPAYFHGGMGEEIFQTQLDQILVERITDVSAKTFSDPMYQLMMAPRS